MEHRGRVGERGRDGHGWIRGGELHLAGGLRRRSRGSDLLILSASLHSQKGASLQPAHPHLPVSRVPPLPVPPHLVLLSPSFFPASRRPRPPLMLHDVASSFLVEYAPFATSGEAGRGHASQAIAGPRLVDPVRRAALLLGVNLTFSFAWMSSPKPSTSGEASPRHASPAIGGRRLVDPARRAAVNLAVSFNLFFARPRSSFPPPCLPPPASLPADDLTRDGDVERNPGPGGRPPRARLFAASAPVGDPAHPFRCPFSSCSALGWATKAPLLAHLVHNISAGSSQTPGS